MISVTEAHAAIHAAVTPGSVESCPLAAAVARVLAVAPQARVDSPGFDNSAMDGFALCHAATTSASATAPVVLPIAGEQLAGPLVAAHFDPATAWRITTGAALPAGATAVVPLEDVEEQGGRVLLRAPVRAGTHVRTRGEEIRAGAAALPAGTMLTPAAVGYLASVGVATVEVHAAPRVAIVPTGTELVPLGQPLQPGQLYESNSVALGAALREFGVVPTVLGPAADDMKQQRAVLETALDASHIVMITGGVSVGQADYVKGLLAALGVESLFWRIRQKPGKPLYFGRRGNTLVFGLPGNPVSSLVCYYEYVRLAIAQWLGWSEPQLPQWKAELTAPITKRPGMTHFLRARTAWQHDRWTTTPIGIQESHRLQPFAVANAFIVLPEESTGAAAGDRVVIHALPSSTAGGLP